MSKHSVESDADFDARYEAFFSRKDIDGWECRKVDLLFAKLMLDLLTISFLWQAMNDLSGMDLIPEPKIIIAALHACRRLDDYALAVRFLETVKDKCGSKVNEIYPYILQVGSTSSRKFFACILRLNHWIQEIKPTLTQLGINTPEELGYDKPELALKTVYEWGIAHHSFAD